MVSGIILQKGPTTQHAGHSELVQEARDGGIAGGI